MGVAWFLLWGMRHATKDEPSGLGVSMGEIPAWQSLTVWYRVACPLDEWGPPCEYGDSLTTVNGLEESFQSLRLVHRSRDYGQQWQRLPGHCCAVRNTSGTAAKPGLSSEGAAALREGNAAESSMLASDLAGRLDKRDGEMEVLTCPFLRLGGQKKKRTRNVESREGSESEEEEEEKGERGRRRRTSQKK